jgi:hypothetical protein
MLPAEPVPRDPLVYPPPEPPLAFANENVGAPTRETMRTVAMRCVVFKGTFLSIQYRADRTGHHHLTARGSEDVLL